MAEQALARMEVVAVSQPVELVEAVARPVRVPVAEPAAVRVSALVGGSQPVALMEAVARTVRVSVLGRVARLVRGRAAPSPALRPL